MDLTSSESNFLLHLHRTRNSILRALALSSWTNLKLYLPLLLHDVKITIIDIFTFADMLKSRMGFGHCIDSICFKNLRSIPEQDEDSLLRHADMITTLPASASLSDRFSQATRVAVQEIYSRIAHPSTLILLDVHFFPNFEVRLGGKVVPNPIFKSLKKLWIIKWEDRDRESNLSGREALWLLVFLPSLEEACLQFDMTSLDFKLLSECSESFKGKSSVSKLTLGFDFHWQPNASKTWWGSAGELSQTWIGRSKKTESIMHLLQVSRRLTCLELFNINETRTGDKTKLFPTCIAALESSFSTLKHLRIIRFTGVVGLDDVGSELPKKLFSSFKSLRILSADMSICSLLARCPSILLPPTIETIFLYSTCSGKLGHDEEMLFTNVLRPRLWPQLKQVLVSSTAFAEYTVPQTSPPNDKKMRRKKLEKLEMFTSGRVKLRIVEGDEIGESVGKVNIRYRRMDRYQK